MRCTEIFESVECEGIRGQIALKKQKSGNLICFSSATDVPQSFTGSTSAKPKNEAPPNAPNKTVSLRCEVCDIWVNSQANLDNHLHGKVHAARLKGEKFCSFYLLFILIESFLFVRQRPSNRLARHGNNAADGAQKCAARAQTWTRRRRHGLQWLS